MGKGESTKRLAEKRESETKNNTVNHILNQLKKFPLIDKDKEIELSKKIQRGNKEALNELIQANLGLVIAFIRRGGYRSNGIPMEDLINYGNLGLIEAAKRFDHKKGCKFSTYATHWIRQQLERNIKNNETIIRIPINQDLAINLLKRYSGELGRKLKRKPTSSEMSKELGMSIEKVEDLKSISYWTKLNLDDPIDEYNKNKNEENHIDVIESLFFPSPENYALQTDASDKLRTVIENELSKLSDKEQFIIRKRLMEYEKVTLEAVGKSLGLTRESIRIIEGKALIKLREALKDRKGELMLLIA